MPYHKRIVFVRHGEALFNLSYAQTVGGRSNSSPLTVLGRAQTEVFKEIDLDPWNFAAPGGESQKQVEQRMTDYITQVVLPSLQAGGPPAVVVSHGVAIKCFLRGILGSNVEMTRKIQLDNTSITEVAWSDVEHDHGWNLLRVNDTSHLVTELGKRILSEVANTDGSTV